MKKINNNILMYVALGLSIVAVILSIYAVVQAKKRVNPFMRFNNRARVEQRAPQITSSIFKKQIAKQQAAQKKGAKPAPVQKVQLPVKTK